MRTLKYAILGLVNSCPSTGYDIAKIFKKELGNFWRARHSQIYPELKKLVDEGLLEYKVVISGEVLEKKLYFIKEKGKKDFFNWLSRDEPMVPTSKDKFRLRMYFSHNIEKEHLINLLESQLEQRLTKLNFLKDRMSKYKEIPKLEEEKYGDYMVLEGAIMREDAYVRWLKKSIKRCQQEK